MTDLRADSMTGEQFVFEERTADPGSTVEGERWLRTDLNSGDKLATLRVDVGGSTLDVPVFPTGTSEDGVTEALRVRVGSQTGYIPAIADTSAAGFPQLRLQHDGQVYGYHNEQGVFAFFDVAISSTNSPVNEGSDLNVDYSVQNTGFSANNTQDIRLQIDTVEEDRDSNITLSPGSSTTGTLTWTTPSSSAGTYNAAVLSDDDTASTSVTVEAGPAIPDSRIENFEDGDITVLKNNWTGWSGDTGALTAQQTTVINGDWSGKLTGSSGSIVEVTATRDTADTPSEVKMLAEVTSRNGDSGDATAILMVFSGSTFVAELGLVADGDNVDVNFDAKTASWDLSTTYLLRMFNINFTNEVFDWEFIDRSDNSTLLSGQDEAFFNSASDLDRIDVETDSNSGSGANSFVFDDVDWVS